MIRRIEFGPLFASAFAVLLVSGSGVFAQTDRASRAAGRQHTRPGLNIGGPPGSIAGGGVIGGVGDTSANSWACKSCARVVGIGSRSAACCLPTTSPLGGASLGTLPITSPEPAPTLSPVPAPTKETPTVPVPEADNSAAPSPSAEEKNLLLLPLVATLGGATGLLLLAFLIRSRTNRRRLAPSPGVFPEPECRGEPIAESSVPQRPAGTN